MEKEAHAFAAAFLLPKENFIKDISIYPTNLNYYKELKKVENFNISYASSSKSSRNYN